MSSPDSTVVEQIARTPRGVDWREFAACKGQVTLFFAKKAERPEARARREAKARRLCDSCPVFEQCRSWAREHREYGYWGGENEEDRYMLGYKVTAPIGSRTRGTGVLERKSA
jgi:WhiB family redox-sensing transcriptional regulator